METDLQEWAGRRGYAAGWYRAGVVGNALEHISRQHAEGAFDQSFHKTSLSWLTSAGTGLQPGEQSVILVAVPRPAHTAAFDYRGKSVELTLPPTYHRYGVLFTEVRDDLSAHLKGRVPLRVLRAPLKAVAAHAGFARYGRNNLAYVDGLGSYIQLIAFASPLPVSDPAVPDCLTPAVLDACYRCTACQRACPTDAIPGDRFLLHAENCLTWFSEYEGTLPEAFGHARRPCLVGCLVCQEACPLNRGRLRVESLDVRFSEEETGFLLGEGAGLAVISEIEAKLDAMSCSGFSFSSGSPNPTLRRNLRAVLGWRRSAGCASGSGS